MDMLRQDLDKGVLTLTLDRPAEMNAVTLELGHALHAALDAAAIDDAVRVLVLTGSGRAFSAGGDVSMLLDTLDDPLPEAEQRAILAVTTGACMKLAAFPKPTIAAINGACAGGGLAYAAACDMRIAAASAKITFAYPRIGLAGDLGSTWLLSRILGSARARQFCLMTPVIDARAAEAIGLIGRVVADDALMDEAHTMARSMASLPPQALAAVKRNLEAAETLPFAEAAAIEMDNFILARKGEEHREAVKGFVRQLAEARADRAARI